MAGTWPSKAGPPTCVGWAEPDGPQGAGFVLVGAPGVGKTRLARVGVRPARDRGAVTDWVVATRTAQEIPLGAFSRLLATGPALPLRCSSHRTTGPDVARRSDSRYRRRPSIGQRLCRAGPPVAVDRNGARGHDGSHGSADPGCVEPHSGRTDMSNALTSLRSIDRPLNHCWLPFWRPHCRPRSSTGSGLPSPSR